jgi:hypothetical protein
MFIAVLRIPIARFGPHPNGPAHHMQTGDPS